MRCQAVDFDFEAAKLGGVDCGPVTSTDLGRLRQMFDGGVTNVDGRRLSQPIEDAEPEHLLQMAEPQVLRLPKKALYR